MMNNQTGKKQTIMDSAIVRRNIIEYDLETIQRIFQRWEVAKLVKETDPPKLTFTREKPTTSTGWQTTAEREEPILILLDFLPSVAPMTIQNRVRGLQREHRRRLTRTVNTKNFDTRKAEKMKAIDDLPTLNVNIEKIKNWTIDDVRKFWNICEEEVRARCAALLTLPHIREKNGYKPIPKEGVNGGVSARDPFYAQHEKQSLIHHCAKSTTLLEKTAGKFEDRRASKSQLEIETEPSKTADEPWFILPKDQIRKKVRLIQDPSKLSRTLDK